MKYMALFVVFAVLVFAGCAADSPTETDTIPPSQPHMITHLGDTGDIRNMGTWQDTVNYYNTNDPGLENNGIDAVADNNWIQIQWNVLLDDDVDYVSIHRFSLGDYQAYMQYLANNNEEYEFATQIDSIASPTQTRYIDHFSNLAGSSVSQTWFYYIKAVDVAGNWTNSDTVCYKLTVKPIPLEPAPYAILDNLQDATFQWNLDSSGTITGYRLLLFDQYHDLLWIYTPLDLEYPMKVYDGPAFTNETFIWRIDAFGAGPESVTIFNRNYVVHSGAESNEFEFTVLP